MTMLIVMLLYVLILNSDNAFFPATPNRILVASRAGVPHDALHPG